MIELSPETEFRRNKNLENTYTCLDVKIVLDCAHLNNHFYLTWAKSSMKSLYVG